MHAHALSELDCPGRWTRAAQYVADEEAGQAVVADLFRRLLFGVEQRVEREVAAIPAVERAGRFRWRVAPAARSAGGRCRCGGRDRRRPARLRVPSRRDPVDGHVGGAKRCPQVVGVDTEPAGNSGEAWPRPGCRWSATARVSATACSYSPMDSRAWATDRYSEPIISSSPEACAAVRPLVAEMEARSASPSLVKNAVAN